MASTGTTESTDQRDLPYRDSPAERAITLASRNAKLRDEFVAKLKQQRVREIEAELAAPLTDQTKWRLWDELHRFKQTNKETGADYQLIDAGRRYCVRNSYHDSWCITKGTVMARIYETLTTDGERKQFILDAYDYMCDARCETGEYHWPSSNRQA